MVLLGRHAGIEGLSARETMHYAATFETRNGPLVNRLVDMFGWNSPATALRRYIESVRIANEGTTRSRPHNALVDISVISYAKEEAKNYSSRLKIKMATAVNRRSISNQLGIIIVYSTASWANVAA